MYTIHSKLSDNDVIIAVAITDTFVEMILPIKDIPLKRHHCDHSRHCCKETGHAFCEKQNITLVKNSLQMIINEKWSYKRWKMDRSRFIQTNEISNQVTHLL